MRQMTFPPAVRLAVVLGLALIAIALAPTPSMSAGSGYSFSIGSGSGAPGGLIAVDVNASAVEPGIGSFTLDIFYDANKVTPQTCRTTFAGCNKDYEPGQIRIAGVPFSPLVGDRLVATLIFQAHPGASGTTELDLTAEDVYGFLGDDLSSSTDITDGTLTITPGGPVVRRGDTTCDGRVDELDGLAILSHLSGEEASPCLAHGDYNCDNRVDVKDAIAILQGIAEIAAPASAC